jgi:hypothetical protein
VKLPAEPVGHAVERVGELAELVVAQRGHARIEIAIRLVASVN